MNNGQEINNYLDYRFSDLNLKESNNLLESQLKNLWLLEVEGERFLKKWANIIESGHIYAVIEQLLLEGDQQIKRLKKISEVLKIEITVSKKCSNKEIVQFMEFRNLALEPFSDDVLVKQWTLILELEKLIHYKMAYYQSMVSWSKFLRLYGIQELLEDSLDEYIHQDLVLNLLSDSWETDA